MSNDTATEKNKLIVKNTLFMYGRMLILLLISLFTARIIFNTLGINDYGTYNLVAGIIVFFTFINKGLSTATNRYITAELAKGDDQSASHTFYICILAHLFIAAIILILAETIGLWGVNYILNIPDDRMPAANWVYQLSVITAVLNVIQSPFGSVIVAYEKMGIYAYFTIFDAIAQLAIIYLVQAINGDKLIIYALLVFVVSIVNMLLYRIYTYQTFPICRMKHRKSDKALLKEIFGFMSWSLTGQAAVVGTNQGVSVLINIYHGVAVNAAMGISNSITKIVNGFVSNFQMAFNPQIVKSYVSEDYSYLQSLILRASKISSYLVIIFLVPLMFETGNVLSVWLGEYPQYAVEFCVFTLISIYVEAISAPLYMTVYAQKNIKSYQIVISMVYSLNFFLGWLVLYLGAVPYSVIIVRIFVFIALMVIRLYFTKKIFAQFAIRGWFAKVFLNSLLIFSAASLVTGYVASAIECGKLLHIIFTTFVSLSISAPMIYFIGLTQRERLFIKEKIIKVIRQNR